MSVDFETPQAVDLPPHEETGAELDLVEERLLARLRTSTRLADATPNDYESVPELIQAYTEAFEVLRYCHAEAETFIRAVCSAHVVAHSPSPDHADQLSKAATKEVNRLCKLTSIPPVTVSNHLHAELVGDAVDQAFEYLSSDLQAAISSLVKSLLFSLEKLRDENVVGTIEWPVASACRFRFFETHIHQRAVQTSVRHERGHGWRKKVTTQRGKVDYTHSANQHQLVFASRSGLDEYTELVPTRIQRLLGQIPSWLKPEIEIVDGDLFRKLRTDRHIKTDQWTKTHVREEKVEEPTYQFDPAVTFGTYVLAAWVVDETQEEQIGIANIRREHRQALADQRRASRRECWQQLGLAARLQLFALILHLLGLIFSPAFHLAAFIFSLGMLYVIPEALTQLALSQDIKSDTAYYVQGMVSVTCGLLAAHAALISIAYGSLPAWLGVCTHGYRLPLLWSRMAKAVWHCSLVTFQFSQLFRALTSIERTARTSTASS